MKESISVPERAYEVFTDVAEERAAQEDKWGIQDHDDLTWLAILSEEVGEASQEILTAQFGAAGNGHGDLREEVVHVAAVALAWIEAIDRRNNGRSDYGPF